MKNLVFLSAILFVFFANIAAQNIPGVPNGSVNKDSRDDYDNGIRLRSMELERIKKESYRSAAAKKSAENRRINYSQIEKDFELLQKLENEIVKTYVTGKEINYTLIGEFAFKLNETAKRLEENLVLVSEKAPKKSKEKKSSSKDIKDLIVDLDRLIGSFTTNPIFQNLNILETKNAEKAELDLQSIIYLSDLLMQQAGKRK